MVKFILDNVTVQISPLIKIIIKSTAYSARRSMETALRALLGTVKIEISLKLSR